MTPVMTFQLASGLSDLTSRLFRPGKKLSSAGVWPLTPPPPLVPVVVVVAPAGVFPSAASGDECERLPLGPLGTADDDVAP